MPTVNLNFDAPSLIARAERALHRMTWTATTPNEPEMRDVNATMYAGTEHEPGLHSLPGQGELPANLERDLRPIPSMCTLVAFDHPDGSRGADGTVTLLSQNGGPTIMRLPPDLAVLALKLATSPPVDDCSNLKRWNT